MPTVGFDLDMTLLDTRPGIRAAMHGLSVATGVPIDADLVVTRLGPPLEQEFANWFPPEAVGAAVLRYREIYATTCAEGSMALPGAAAAVDAVRRTGGRVVVVTAKSTPLAEVCLAAAGLEVDAVEGYRWGAGKGEALAAHAAEVYVGDHTADVAGALTCGATPVGVATGPVTAEDLRTAGAEVVLDSLEDFPGWYADHVALARRMAVLTARLRDLGAVCVAFSGGVDSTFLLAAAARTLRPDRILAVTAVSPSPVSGELERARGLAQEIGVRHVVVETDELARAGYRENAGDRCSHCKSELLDVVSPVAADHGVPTVVTGTNADDVVSGLRPGIRAAAERGAVAPLAEAALTKADVRVLSRRWGLSR